MTARPIRRATQVLVAAATASAAVVASAAPAAADLPGAGIVTDAIGDLVGGATGWAFEKVAEGIANWVLGAVGYFVGGVVDFLRSSVSPDVGSVWFSGAGSPYATVSNLAAVLLVGFVFLGLLQGLLHGDAFGMVRRMAGGLPAAVAGMVVTTTVVGYLLELTDAMSNAVLASSDDQVLKFLSGFGLVVTTASSGFAAVVVGLVAVIAGLLLWIELLVRSSLVYLLVAISPMGFAATLWPAARGVLRKTVEILLAVILSKFVIAVALSIGVAALAGAGSAGAGSGEPLPGAAGASLGTLLVGTVLLGLAAFSPFVVLKLIPIAEGALLAQGISHSPARAAQSGVSTYSSARMITRLSGSGGMSPGGAGADPWALPPDTAGAAAGGGPTSPPAGPAGSGPTGASGGAAGARGGAAAGAGGAVLVGAGAAAGRAKETAQRAAAEAANRHTDASKPDPSENT